MTLLRPQFPRSFWAIVAVAALLVPSAGVAGSQGTPVVTGTRDQRERRQPYRPSYILREEPGRDEEPTFSIGISFLQRLEVQRKGKAADGTNALPPTVSGSALPKQVFLQHDAGVLLRLVSGKVTSRHKPGHQVTFEVEEDVRTGDATCIAQGTPVQGVVGPGTRTARGVSGTGRLEIQFEDVPMVTDMRAPLQTIRVIGRTLRESLSWVCRVQPQTEGEVFAIAAAALGHLMGEVTARAVFRTDEVKLRKGDVIRVNLWASWPLPCNLATLSGGTDEPTALRRDADGGGEPPKHSPLRSNRQREAP